MPRTALVVGRGVLAGALVPVVIRAGVACWELLGGSLAASRAAPVGAAPVGGATCSVVVASTRPAAGACSAARAVPLVVAGEPAWVSTARLLAVGAGYSLVVVGSTADWLAAVLAAHRGAQVRRARGSRISHWAGCLLAAAARRATPGRRRAPVPPARVRNRACGAGFADALRPANGDGRGSGGRG